LSSRRILVVGLNSNRLFGFATNRRTPLQPLPLRIFALAASTIVGARAVPSPPSPPIALDRVPSGASGHVVDAAIFAASASGFDLLLASPAAAGLPRRAGCSLCPTNPSDFTRSVPLHGQFVVQPPKRTYYRTRVVLSRLLATHGHYNVSSPTLPTRAAEPICSRFSTTGRPPPNTWMRSGLRVPAR
jgi:hypothetical protein